MAVGEDGASRCLHRAWFSTREGEQLDLYKTAGFCSFYRKRSPMFLGRASLQTHMIKESFTTQEASMGLGAWLSHCGCLACVMHWVDSCTPR